MNFYKQIPYFSSTTGELLGTRKELECRVCDLCGGDLDDVLDTIVYKASDEGGCEPYYYEEEILVTINGKEIQIDPTSLFGDEEFIFHTGWDGNHTCDSAVLYEFGPKSSYIFEIFMKARIHMVTSALEAGQYTMEDFNLEVR